MAPPPPPRDEADTPLEVDGLPIPVAESEQYCHMGARISRIEGRLDMAAENLAGHAADEHAQYIEIARQVQELHRKMDRLVVRPVKKIFGGETDFDQMTDNVAAIGRVASMMKWFLKMLVAVIAGLMTLLGVFHLTDSKGEEVLPPDHGSAERGVGE